MLIYLKLPIFSSYATYNPQAFWNSFSGKPDLDELLKVQNTTRDVILARKIIAFIYNVFKCAINLIFSTQ